MLIDTYKNKVNLPVGHLVGVQCHRAISPLAFRHQHIVAAGLGFIHFFQHRR